MAQNVQDLPPAANEAERRWDKSMEEMRVGIKSIFTLDLEESAAVFEKGMARDLDTDPLVDEEYDLRGSFGLMNSLAALLHGLASLADDQLRECQDRVWRAEGMAQLDKEWDGKNIVRGVCFLMGGVVQCMQHSFAKGVWNILRCWPFISGLDKTALHATGREGMVVRSAALMTLGVFNLIISILPPTMLRAATFMTGYDGDRAKALQMLEQCWHEGGMLSCFAAIVRAGFAIDTKTFLGENQEEEREFAHKIVNWSKEIFSQDTPSLFTGLEADLHACEHRLEEAKECMIRLQVTVGTKLKALNLVTHYKLATYNLAGLSFAESVGFFESAYKVHMQVERRAMVPFMACYAGLAAAAAGDAERSEANFKIVQEYKEKPKKNWGRQDQYAFAVLASRQEGTLCPMLELAECMCLRSRVVNFMTPEQLKDLAGRVAEATIGGSPSQQVAAYYVRAECYEYAGDRDTAMQIATEGLALESTVTCDRAWEGGFDGLHWVAAKIHACRTEIPQATAHLDKITRGSIVLSFRATQLKKHMGAQFEDLYRAVAVGAGATVIEDIPVKEARTVEWDFMLEGYSVDFRVVWVKESGEETEVEAMSRREFENGPVAGSYDAPGPGTLRLIFDNSFSYFRGKSLNLRTE
mmetsp:Transcript_24103/g.54954  ORF Transcript_24103/g.54954 Transcript_24103/m.54954 type:complete len:639 (+) Transcript_24103:80-1996(+)